jgi:hypothetical protein
MKSPVSFKIAQTMAGCSDGPCLPYIEIGRVTKSRVPPSTAMITKKTTPPIVTESTPEHCEPPTAVTPPPSLQIAELPAVDDIATCSSSATDDMLDTVEECVGCVNQISLQHDFEDSLVDLPLVQHHPSLPEMPSDDTLDGISNTLDGISNLRKKQLGSLLYTNDSASLIQEEEVPSGAEMDLLNWCSGGYNGH